MDIPYRYILGKLTHFVKNICKGDYANESI